MHSSRGTRFLLILAFMNMSLGLTRNMVSRNTGPVCTFCAYRGVLLWLQQREGPTTLTDLGVELEAVEEVLPEVPLYPGTPATPSEVRGTAQSCWPYRRVLKPTLRVTRDVDTGAVLASVPVDCSTVPMGRDPGDLLCCLVKHAVEEGVARSDSLGTLGTVSAAVRWLASHVSASPALRMAGGGGTAERMVRALSGTDVAAVPVRCPTVQMYMSASALASWCVRSQLCHLCFSHVWCATFLMRPVGQRGSTGSFIEMNGV